MSVDKRKVIEILNDRIFELQALSDPRSGEEHNKRISIRIEELQFTSSMIKDLPELTPTANVQRIMDYLKERIRNADQIDRWDSGDLNNIARVEVKTLRDVTAFIQDLPGVDSDLKKEYTPPGSKQESSASLNDEEQKATLFVQALELVEDLESPGTFLDYPLDFQLKLNELIAAHNKLVLLVPEARASVDLMEWANSTIREELNKEDSGESL